VSGQVVGDGGEPLRGIRVALIQVSLADCRHDANMETSFDGSFQFDAPPAVYVIRSEAPTPLYPRLIRVDARRGDQRAIRVQLTRQPSRYVPDNPPRAARISVLTPNERGEVTVRGAAAAVAPNSHVILVNTDTGDAAFAEAGADGAFQATLFAPAGTSILVKSDPYGDTMRNVAAQAFGRMQGRIGPYFLPGVPEDVIFGPIGPLAPLPGTFIDVPLPGADGGRVAISGTGGWDYSNRSLPSWIVRGSMNKDRFSAGESLELTATISIYSPVLAKVEKIGVNAGLSLERLAFGDGRPALGHAVRVSSILTPSGFAIMHSISPSSPRYSAVARFDIPRTAPDRAESAFAMRFTLSADMPSGYYRLLLDFFFDGYPNEEAPSRPQVLLDSANRDRASAMSLPPIRVGAPAAPRLFWTLLTDTLTEGTRGAMALEDERCCAMTAIVQIPSKHLVVPRIDERTQTPIVYRLEPFAPMISAGDRGLTPTPPAVRFRFPSGRLTVRVERPDGIVETIGPAPFVQARVAGPLDRHGRVPDPGGLSLHDAYQLTTLDPRFEVTFPAEGPYRITLDGEIEDFAGTKWLGHWHV